MLERGDKIELLVDKSEQLRYGDINAFSFARDGLLIPNLVGVHSSQSSAFAQTSRSLRRKLWLENVKMMIAIGLVAIVRLRMHGEALLRAADVLTVCSCF